MSIALCQYVKIRDSAEIMDEIARRREARRRKILENSQNRLQKITGVESTPDPEPVYEEAENERPPAEFLTDEIEIQPQNNQRRQERPQKRYRTTVIMALAVFVNCQLFLLEKFYKFDLNSSHLNKIFVPILAYEVIEFFSSDRYRNENKNFLYLLIVANAKNSHLLPLIKHVGIITNVLQDVMIYFFIYVSCDLVKYSLLLFS